VNHQTVYVRVPAVQWLRTCSCGGRMYRITECGCHFCGVCERMENRDGAEVKPDYYIGDSRNHRRIRLLRGAA
jgi:hypothetical protein